MGGCLSNSESTDIRNPSSANCNVVSPSGELLRYPLPATVAKVLQSQSSPDSVFLCNSDRLYFDDFIPSLDLHEDLEPAQIYFILPTSKLQYRLAASDMAALAVKASLAFEQINGSDRRSKRKNRISPVFVSSSSEEDPQSNRTFNPIKSSGDLHRPAGLGITRSGSVRKLTKYSSRRAKLAVRSFRLKLNTIYEGSVLLLT
ncbi:hypothetical protein ABFX02_03G002300 [Erythranthe guttata]